MTIHEIAKKAKTSKSTVSRVLTDPKMVEPVTLFRVREIMKKHNFEPRRDKRRRQPLSFLESKRTNNIAILFPDTNSQAVNTPLSSSLVHSLEESLYQSKKSLFVTHLRPDGELPLCISRGQVDGVVIRSGNENSKLLSQLKSIPAVMIFESADAIGRMDIVCPDDQRHGHMAYEFLKERGCRSFAVLNPWAGGHLPTETRIAAFKKIAAETGEEFYHLEEKGGAMLAPRLIERYLKIPRPPDGIFCLGADADVEALYRGLREKDLTPGRDLQIIFSINDPLRLKSLDSSLYYIDIRPDILGAKAVEMLLERIDRPETAPREIFIEPKLIPGSGGN